MICLIFVLVYHKRLYLVYVKQANMKKWKPYILPSGLFSYYTIITVNSVLFGSEKNSYCYRSAPEHSMLQTLPNCSVGSLIEIHRKNHRNRFDISSGLNYGSGIAFEMLELSF